MPDWLLDVILVILGIALLVFCVMGLVVYRLLVQGRDPNLRLAEVDDSDDTYAEPIKYCEQYQEWALAEGFTHVGNYLLDITPPAFIAAWQHRETPSFFCIYSVKEGPTRRQSYDLVTIFQQDIGLTTGSNKDGHLFPRHPTSYQQTFSGEPVEQLWQRHVEAERYLTDVGKIQMYALEEPFQNNFMDAFRKQMAYVQNLALWPVRVPWWYFRRRHKWHNRSIEQQHQDGWIQFPDELKADQAPANR